jgi:hypothetical protein
LNIVELIFGKPHSKKRKRRDVIEDDEIEPEITHEKSAKKHIIDDDSILEDVEDIEEEVKVTKYKPKKKINVDVPKGKALITIDKRSYLSIFLGLGILMVNLGFLVGAFIGIVSLWEQKLAIVIYTVPAIYVTGNFIWYKIQGQKIEDDMIE